MSYASPNFGTVNIERPQPSTAGAFWTTARREHFTQLCERMYWDHMRGSLGDKVVSGAVVVGYLEGPKRQKGAR